MTDISSYEAAQAQRARDEYLRRLEALPRNRRALELADLDPHGRQPIFEAIRRLLAEETQGLLLHGPVGVGKTTIMAAACHDETKARPVTWITAAAYVDGLTGPFNSRERERSERLRNPSGRHGRPNLLAIDDLDKTRTTEHAAEAVFALLDASEAHGRPLIVTTNLKPSELAAKWAAPYGASIASRLVGQCEVHEITGRDRRLDHQGTAR